MAKLSKQTNPTMHNISMRLPRKKYQKVGISRVYVGHSSLLLGDTSEIEKSLAVWFFPWQCSSQNGWGFSAIRRNEVGKRNKCPARRLSGKEGSYRHLRWEDARDADDVGARNGKTAPKDR